MKWLFIQTPEGMIKTLPEQGCSGDIKAKLRDDLDTFKLWNLLNLCEDIFKHSNPS